jgi:hypothetical protein
MALLDSFSRLFAALAEEQLKVLLETKHIYQKVSIQPETIISSLMKNVVQAQQANHSSTIQKGLQQKFDLTETPTFIEANVLQLFIPVRNVKLFCQKCDAREAFKPILYSDVTFELLSKHNTQRVMRTETFKILYSTDFQLFVLVFQCQRCEFIPTVFIVKREGTDLMLEGRSPIEYVELPKFIPKEERKWFRDGVIAFQSGKVLAALFYMRTFIEQFARRKTGTLGDKKTGDEILTAYAATIPLNLRETMPSLAEWYDKLSAVIHTATEDAALFGAAREKIEEHFDIRRVHKLDQTQLS